MAMPMSAAKGCRKYGCYWSHPREVHFRKCSVNKRARNVGYILGDTVRLACMGSFLSWSWRYQGEVGYRANELRVILSKYAADV
jgi:hypothetical protein